MTQTEALRLALKALEMSDICADDCKCTRKRAINAIKAALEAKDEPVGKFAKFTDGIWREVTDGSAGVPLYTTSLQSKPLTDEHPLMVFAKECVLGAYRESELADAAQRAIKAAHGIKGEA